MNWYFKEDKTTPIIQAKEHIQSQHRQSSLKQLPETAILFCFSKGIDTLVAMDKPIITGMLPTFLNSRPYYILKEHPHLCYLHGGYSAPMMADTIETLHSLGVKRVYLFGLCGAFREDIMIGDLIIPNKVYSEEGTTRHYYANQEWFYPTDFFQNRLIQYFHPFFNIHNTGIVTMDACFRQTYFKEEKWRKMDCFGVEMEAAAMIGVCRLYQMDCGVALLVSDKHPMRLSQENWNFGNTHFTKLRKQFAQQIIEWHI